MLRSVSASSHGDSGINETSRGDWKLKQDGEEYRVMYREGPEGSPFHTLLVEGYVDGPVDVCLCISWESALYKKWWPQYTIPAFKVISSNCLQRIRVGEQISLVRVKVSWPLSVREALVHYFAFEYFQDDLVVILVNTISDLGTIDKATHGFTNEGIPEAEDVVRIDVVGGFAIQKVTPERSYFRTIANMDIKLDFVPPSLINFISRQLIGNGFKLYQKVVTSVCNESNRDEGYSKALGNPLYTKIRKALYGIEESDDPRKENEMKGSECIIPQQQLIKDVETEGFAMDMEQKFHSHESESSPENRQTTGGRTFGEIEEEESEDTSQDEVSLKVIDKSEANKIEAGSQVNGKRSVFVRPEVEEALGTLEKAISMIREYGFGVASGSPSSFSDEEPSSLEKDPVKDSNSFEDDSSSTKVSIEISKTEAAVRTSHESLNSSAINGVRRAGSNSFSREVNHNKIVPASPEKDILLPTKLDHVTLNSSTDRKMEVPVSDQTRSEKKPLSAEANGRKKLKQQKKYRFCCLSFNSK
ncbi:uncharacterized protein LOC110810580 isoform X2 [Carica papaya]|nr:uncharacterized protein LOC110810580 isoform X2 [Carica papaya]